MFRGSYAQQMKYTAGQCSADLNVPRMKSSADEIYRGSLFRGLNVPRIHCSTDEMFRGSMFRGLNVARVNCSADYMFRRWNVPQVNVTRVKIFRGSNVIVPRMKCPAGQCPAD